MKNWSIQHRVLVVALLPMVCMAVFLSVYFSRLQLLHIEHAELEKAQAVAIHLAPTSEFAVVTGNHELLDTITHSTLARERFVRVTINDGNGERLSQAERELTSEPASWATRLRPFISETPLRVTVNAPIVPTRVDSLDEFDAELASARPEPIGWVEIEIDFSTFLQAEFETLTESFLLTLVALLVTAMLASWIARSVSKPIKSLTLTVEQLRRGNLARRVQTHSGGELGRLELGINEMAATIQASQHRLEEEIAKATRNLKSALVELAHRNDELEEARHAAEQASDFKSQFLANMSHEIRTPINVILGFSELLSKTSRDPLHRNYLETIHGSAQSLLSLLNDILDLSKVESGQMALECTSVDLNAVLREVSALFAPAAYSRRLEFLLAQLDPGEANAMTDPLRLRQVLVNLTSNAVKFTEKGHVLVSAEVTASTSSQRWYRFTVSDTGVGIPHAAQGKLFRAFSQGDRATGRRFGGSGLGLHIASEIVLLMDGDVAFESEPGKGATFWFTVPLQIDPQAAPATTDPVPLNAVIVDDYPPLRGAYRRLFEQAGLRLEHAGDGPGVVLANISAPALHDGRTPAPESLRGPPDWPRIAYCGAYDPPTVRRMLHAGFQGVLLKTHDPRRLRAELDAALEPDALQPPPAPPEKPPSPAQSAHLLVIDDHVVNLKLMESYARYLGLRIHCEDSPDVALDVAQRQPFDLIITDLHMPDMDGREVARRIRHGGGVNREVPIVALTADAYQQEADLHDTGISALVVKPVSLDTFRKVVEQWGPRKPHPPQPAPTDIAAQLRRVLLERLPQHRAEIEAAARAADMAELRFHAHRLHGASVYCDLPELTSAARQLESLAASEAQEPASAAAAQLIETIDMALGSHV